MSSTNTPAPLQAPDFSAVLREVAEMRRLQKLYFKSFDGRVLQAAKAKERDVDRQLAQLGVSEPDNVPRLF